MHGTMNLTFINLLTVQMWIWNAEKLLPPHNEHAVRARNYLQQGLLFMTMSTYFFSCKGKFNDNQKLE
jgi:hypothetical protein